MHQNVSSSGPILLTLTEAGREPGVSREAVGRLTSAGKLTAVELDTGSLPPSKRIRRSDLIDLRQQDGVVTARQF